MLFKYVSLLVLTIIIWAFTSEIIIEKKLNYSRRNFDFWNIKTIIGSAVLAQLGVVYLFII
jgi:hypothetical protein